MPRTTAVVPALTGGVSQQADPIRLSTELERQDNAWTSLVDVMRPRHHTEHLGRLYQDLAVQRGGSVLLHGLDRGDDERYLHAFGNADPRVFDADTGVLIPLKARQCAWAIFKVLPADNTTLTVDGLPNGSAKNFIFDGTSPPSDSDPNYYIDTSGGKFDTIEKANAECARKITSVAAASATAYAHGNVLTVIDKTIGDNASLLVKSGGDSATSIKVVCHQFQKFLPMQPIVTPLLPLVEAEDLSDNTGSTQADPVAALDIGSVAFSEASHPWRSFGTCPTAEYNLSQAGVLGVFGGGYTVAGLRGVSNGNNQEAYWYYRFVKPSEPAYLNKFAPLGLTQVVSAYLEIDPATVAAITSVGFGYLNASSGLWKRVDFTVSGTTLTGAMSNVNNAKGGVEDLGFGRYRVWCAYKTADVTEEGQERRLAFYLPFATSGLDKRIIVRAALLEHTTGRTTPGRFYLKPHEGNQLLSLANTTFWLNKASTVAIDKSRKTAAQVGDEAYIWCHDPNYDSVYGVKVKQGSAELKAATATISAPGAGGAALCAMFKPAGTLTKALCEETATVQDYAKGVFFTAGAGPIGSQRCEDVTSQGIALNLALRDETGSTQADDGIKPKFTTGSFSGSNTVEVNGSVIRLTSPNAIDDLQVWDSNGGDSLTKIHKTVPALDSLPEKGPCKDGFKVKVIGDPEADQDDFWMMFVADKAGDFGPGHWEQTVAYNTETSFDPTTLPWILVPRLDDNVGTVTTKGKSRYIEASLAAWDDRQLGDTTSNKNPSFVGQALQAMSFFRGRMSFISAVALICSRANSTGTFFRTDITQLLDDDRIDRNITGEDVAKLLHAVPFEKTLNVISKTSRFSVGGAPFTERTIEADVVEHEEVHEFTRPWKMSKSVFFSRRKGDFSSVKEFFPSEEAQTSRSFSVSARVSQYIKGDIIQIAGSTLEDLLVFVADGEPRYLTLFKFQDSGGQRAQAAWHRYDFGADAKIRGAHFIGAYLYLAVERKFDVMLERMRITDKATDPGVNWECLLDRRVSEDTPGVSRSYAGGPDQTTFTLPYRLDVESAAGVKIVDRADASLIPVVSVGLVGGKSTVVVAGDKTATSFFAGIPYTMRIEGKILLREQRGQGQSAASAGTRVSEKAYLSYHDAAPGSFRVLLTNKQGVDVPAGVHTIGEPGEDKIQAATAGNIARYSGRWPIGMTGYPEQVSFAIESTGHLPFYLSKIEVPMYIDREAYERGG